MAKDTSNETTQERKRATYKAVRPVAIDGVRYEAGAKVEIDVDTAKAFGKDYLQKE